MISFVKFLKIVLPIISATTATLTTASLVSRKKHDPDEKAKSKEINLNSFVALNEDFKEKLLLFSTDGKGENVTVEDAEKAKKLIDNLKKDGSEGDLPDFKSAEEAMEFLEKMPEKILSDLLKGSNLSDEELSKLGASKFGKEGKLGKVLRSPNFGFAGRMNYPQDSSMQRNMASPDDFNSPSNMFNNGMPKSPNLSMNMEGRPNLPKPDLGQMGQMPNIQPTNIDSNSLDALGGAAEALSNFGLGMQQDMSIPSPPSIDVNGIPNPKMPDIDVNIKFGESRDQHDSVNQDQSEGQGDQNDNEPVDVSSSLGPSGDSAGSEVNDDLREGNGGHQDMDVSKDLPQFDSSQPTNKIPEGNPLPEPSQDLKQDHDHPNSIKESLPMPHNPADPKDVSAPKFSNDIGSNEAVKLDLQMPEIPNMVLPDLSSLSDIFGDLFKGNSFGTGGSEEKLTLGDLKKLASSVHTTERQLDKLIQNS